MPLKHATETQMVFFLGLVIALTGAVAAFLPPVSVTIIPWALAFIASLIYALAFYPMMKERRADYEFRALHFVPAIILLLWLALDLIVSFRPDWQILQSLYTWGWSAVVVIGAFVLIVLFCLRVIRQRWPRLSLLAAVLVPFLILSQLSQQMEWDRQLGMMLWDGSEQTGSGVIAGGGTSSNLAPSSDSAEEQWRAQLRAMERRRQELAAQNSSGAASSIIIAVNTGSAVASVGIPRPPIGTDITNPPQLAHSGFGPEILMLGTAAAYCAALHRRTMKRFRVHC
jgi:hypothetical protein